jgi:hypothetical protein
MTLTTLKTLSAQRPAQRLLLSTNTKADAVHCVAAGGPASRVRLIVVEEVLTRPRSTDVLWAPRRAVAGRLGLLSIPAMGPSVSLIEGQSPGVRLPQASEPRHLRHQTTCIAFPSRTSALARAGPAPGKRNAQSRLLRRVLDAFRPEDDGSADRAIGRRVEGAIIATELAAGEPPPRLAASEQVGTLPPATE